jgi:hypothetical protein
MIVWRHRGVTVDSAMFLTLLTLLNLGTQLLFLLERGAIFGGGYTGTGSHSRTQADTSTGKGGVTCLWREVASDA